MMKSIIVLKIIVLCCIGIIDAAPDKGVQQTDPRLNAPWAAAIFKKTSENNWEFICSGTVTGRYTIITSARCLVPRVFGSNKLSTRPYHFRYSDLQVVVGLPTTDLSSKDKYTQFGIVGQIRDVHDHHRSGDTPEVDLATIRLKNQLDLSTPYVKNVKLMESSGTLMEVNETKAGEVLLVAGYEKERDGGVKTRTQESANKAGKPLKIFEVTVEDTAKCIDKYLASYKYVYYFNVFCAKLSKKTDIIPCHHEGSGLVKKVVDSSREEGYYLFGVYSSNSALAKTEGAQMEKNAMTPPPCTSSDLIFATKYAHLQRWAISSLFCDHELGMCNNDKCRPWSDFCDGKVDCEDGSDEATRACNNQNKGAVITTSTTMTATTSTTTISPALKINSNKNTNAKAVTTKAPTTPNGTCEGIKEQQTVTAQCSHPNRPGPIPCGDPVPIGTTAVLKNKEVVISCGQDGKWSRSTRLTC